LKFKTDFDKLNNEMNGKKNLTPQNVYSESNEFDLGLILNIWETKGFEKAMDKLKL
jgi:hypothetical protein